MEKKRFYCIHCLRSDKVVRTFHETLPALIEHIAREHHPNQPLHGRDWLWGDDELDAFRELEQQKIAQEQRRLTGIEAAVQRLEAVETVDDFLKLIGR